MSKNRTIKEFVIPNAGTESPVYNTGVGTYTLVGIHVPSMTGTGLSFKAAKDSSATAQPVKKIDNSLYSVTISAATAAYYPIDPTVFDGIEYLSIVSNASEAAQRTLYLVFAQT